MMDAMNIFSLLGEEVETSTPCHLFEEKCKKLCEDYISKWDVASRERMQEELSCYKLIGYSKLVDAEMNKGLRKIIEYFNKAEPLTWESTFLEDHLSNLLMELGYSAHPAEIIERWKTDRGNYQRAAPKPSLTR